MYGCAIWSASWYVLSCPSLGDAENLPSECRFDQPSLWPSLLTKDPVREFGIERVHLLHPRRLPWNSQVCHCSQGSPSRRPGFPPGPAIRDHLIGQYSVKGVGFQRASFCFMNIFIPPVGRRQKHSHAEAGGTGEMSGWTGKHERNLAAPPVAQGCIAAQELAFKIIQQVTNWCKREYFRVVERLVLYCPSLNLQWRVAQF